MVSIPNPISSPSTGNSNLKLAPIWLVVVILFSCRSLVTTYEDVESAIYYADASQESAEFNDTLKVMTWNIRFGAGRIPFFGDSCGDRVLMTKAETKGYLDSIVSYINLTLPDILLLQEVDVSSKRSAYVNQLQYILDGTHLNYGTYASMWDAEIVPSDGLGKVDVGNAVLSRWEITDAERIQLPLRTDQDALTQYFYLRRNILKAKIDLPLENNFYAVNTHATAFATDDTKEKHINQYIEVLNKINMDGGKFIAGGDLNSLTPWASKKDFCEDDKCEGEICDGNYETNLAYEGTYFEFTPGEINLLRPLYNYFPAIDSLSLQQNEADYFTHSPWNTNYSGVDEYWDRKLDYLFTNYQDWSEGITHNDINKISDHAPVSATLTFPSQ